MIKKLKAKYSKFRNDIIVSKSLSEDIYGFEVLRPLLEGGSYLPFSGGALRPINLSYVVNDITINNRSQILEFGSGISTIVIARLLKRQNSKGKLIAIEHNENWANQLNEILKKEDLSKYAQVVFKSLKNQESNSVFGNLSWYNLSKEDLSVFFDEIDLVLIDGPPANSKEIKHSRFIAFPTCFDLLGKDCTVILDDYNRVGEKEIVKEWESQFDVKFKIRLNNLAVYSTNNIIDPLPYKF